jgi:DNA modification methylase
MPNEYQKIEQSKGRPLLQWVGKKPLEGIEYYPAQEKEVYGDKNAKDFNKLFWGDNLQVLAHLLKEYRGKVDLIYIDPPFASEAEYVKKVRIRGEKVAGVKQGLFEEKQYTDIWERDEYLQFMYERLLLMKELLSDTGSIYLHCDWHKSGYLRLVLDEVFGEQNIVNEVTWRYFTGMRVESYFNRKHDTIFFYARNIKKRKFNPQWDTRIYPYKPSMEDKMGRIQEIECENCHSGSGVFKNTILADDTWEVQQVFNMSNEYASYPTQKPEELLERIIEASSSEGDVIADFFLGSGTTCAVAQKLRRKWIGCDINLGAIQTTTKRLNQIIADQQKEKTKNFKGSLGFKVLNVNDYDVFKNEAVAKDIVMEMYGVEPIKRSYFDGLLERDLVKIMPMNRVLNKMDIGNILKNVQDAIGNFTVRTQQRAKDSVYEEKVRVICSGVEYDVPNFMRKENKTGVVIEINDILADTKELIFKEYAESKIEVSAKDRGLSVEIKEFFSPILMRKLEVENAKVLKKEEKARVSDFKQIIDSVAIDVDYDGKLFNAEVMDLPDKKKIIKAKYSWEYPKKGKYTVAVKIIDVLGEEYFETFEVNV